MATNSTYHAIIYLQLFVMLDLMAGGLCCSELRAAERLMEDGGPEVIIGSSNFNNPGSFVGDIASLEYGVTRR